MQRANSEIVISINTKVILGMSALGTKMFSSVADSKNR
jgi:hypothetical protein